jgi:signal transduction histidine kinase
VRQTSVRARLLWSFLAVALTGGVIFAVATRMLVPRLFDHTMGQGQGLGRPDGAGSGSGTGGGPGGVGTGGGGTGGSGQIITITGERDAVVSAVNTATAIALAATLLMALVLAIFLSRRGVRKLDALRAATRQLAEGRYETRVEPPRERELAALADDVNHLAATLAATEQHRAALIGDVAHEMRTPLTTMTGVVEGYADGLFTADELASTASSELERLHHLARDLAAVSKADEGQLSLSTAPGDLAEAARVVASRLQGQFDAKRVSLVLHADTPVPVLMDRERVVQAITNLVGNALAYTAAEGTVTVTAVTDVDADAATVTVADNGRGLHADDLTKVFERFYRADPADHAGGTGIGLTIARAIARAHGGDLTASSPGRGLGSTFVLSLPA